MEEGFGQTSFKTFVLEMGLLTGLVKGAMLDSSCSLEESFVFVASVIFGTSCPSFDLKADVTSGVLLEAATLYGLVARE